MSKIPPGAIGALGFDPEAVLLKEPGILLDPHFLSALHAELRSELGNSDANLTLLQMGFLHGLQDGMRAVNAAFGHEQPETGNSVGPSLAFQLCATPDNAEPGAISLSGLWPEQIEASAYLAALGDAEHPSCFLSAGYTSGWLTGTLDADILALESSCSACGAGKCSFSAQEASVWRDSGDPTALKILEALPFAVFRAFVGANLDSLEDPMPVSDRVDPGSSIVHIWGPVMVVPFQGGDGALNAIELLGSDPAAHDVSVVVVDLSEAIVDEGFDAIALEQLVELIEDWGAEVVFAAVSPLSETVIAELERPPLLIHKDLAEAIAAAFRLANAQRNPA
ncbi:MAG: XylR N-terminal domain-containing protein [Deltaproteobacteria bacterium]|nr:XylR N-terminal domain-containing protein [Deltaproteobacteria bacterium]